MVAHELHSATVANEYIPTFVETFYRFFYLLLLYIYNILYNTNISRVLYFHTLKFHYYNGT